MHRWFWDIEKQVCRVSPTPSPTSSDIDARKPECEPVVCDRVWTFTVRVLEPLKANEVIAIVGSCPHLGNWSFQAGVQLLNEYDGVWSVALEIPSNIKTLYRYMICAVDTSKQQRIVRKWETHLQPRVVPAVGDDIEVASTETTEQPMDVFGIHHDQYKLDRGWLTSEIMVQLKFFNAPFNLGGKNRLLYVKVTPVRATTPEDCQHPLRQVHSNHSFLDQKLCKDEKRQDKERTLSTAFAFCEVASLFAEDQTLQYQPKYGTKCDHDDLLYFHLTLGDIEHTIFLIELYTYSSKAAADEPPYHFGYQYVHSSKLQGTSGNLEVKIICASRHRPIGRMNFSYLIMLPMPAAPDTMLVSYERFWSHKWDSMEVGHRGLGTSFKANDTVIRENTISSIRNARIFGADMVEFDVQLTKDLVPVIYHDYFVYISVKPHIKNVEDDDEFVKIPLSQLTLQQLKELKVLDSTKYRFCRKHCGLQDESQHYRPFPTLEELFSNIEITVGFNIEVKWPQKRIVPDKDLSIKYKIDRNLYIDTILDVVLRKALNRFTIFSCFDADTCTMIRYKQNRYPVLFLNDIGAFEDPRTQSLEACIFNCIAMEFLGIMPRVDNILVNKHKLALAQDCGLVVFCWGAIKSQDTIAYLKQLGINAVIYDMIHILNTQAEGQQIFVVRADECEVEAIVELAKLLDSEQNVKYKSKEHKPKCFVCREKPVGTVLRKSKI